MDNLSRLETMAKNLGLSSEAMDELVHDAHDRVAAAINNEGVTSQLEYLIEQYGARTVEKMLVSAKKDRE